MFLCVVCARPDFWDVPDLCSKGTHSANLLSRRLLPVLTLVHPKDSVISDTERARSKLCLLQQVLVWVKGSYARAYFSLPSSSSWRECLTLQEFEWRQQHTLDAC